MPSGKAENIRPVHYAVRIVIVITADVFDKGMRRKKVETRRTVHTGCVTVHVVYQIGKVHRHRVERLHFASDIDVAQFDKCTESPAFYNGVVFRIAPDETGISVIVDNRAKVEAARDAALNEYAPVDMYHEFVFVAVTRRTIHEFRKLIDEEIPLVEQIVRIVSHTARTHDLSVESGNLFGIIVDLLYRRVDIAVYERVHSLQTFVALVYRIGKRNTARNDSLTGCDVFRMNRQLLPRFPKFIHSTADRNVVGFVVNLLEHRIVFAARIPIRFLIRLFDDAPIEQFVADPPYAGRDNALTDHARLFGAFEFRKIQRIEFFKRDTLTRIAFRIRIRNIVTGGRDRRRMRHDAALTELYSRKCRTHISPHKILIDGRNDWKN